MYPLRSRNKAANALYVALHRADMLDRRVLSNQVTRVPSRLCFELVTLQGVLVKLERLQPLSHHCRQSAKFDYY